MRRPLGALLCLGSLATLSAPIATAHAAANPQLARGDTGTSATAVRPSRVSAGIPVPPPPPRATPAPTPTAAPPVPRSTTVDEVLRLTNAERRRGGCGPLTHDPRLRSTAQAHSDDMAAANKLILPTTDDIKAGGFTPLAAWGGNLGSGYSSPAAAVAGWMNSAANRNRILNCSYTLAGVGHASSRQGVPYWTLIFAGR